jgi:hypothetical protein
MPARDAPTLEEQQLPFVHDAVGEAGGASEF